MKLEVGMYVRVNKNIRKICIGIGKIEKIYQDTIYVDMKHNLPTSFQIDEISNASNDITDLIECLDIVELYVIGLEEDNITTLKRAETLGELKELKNFIKRGAKIKSITTKEQFESMSYKVKE